MEKMNCCLVSVIITTYGRAGNLIYEAINSVRKQTYKNIEIIIVDDNGVGTEIQKNNEIIFQDESDIMYIANKKNSGAQVSRNVGILASNGKYIACLDDDDIWMPEKIEKQVKLMEEENLALVFCNGYRFYDNDLNKKKIYQYNFISNRDLDFTTELRSDRIGSTSIPLMRRDCLSQTGLFDVNMPARQDYDMWLRFCRYFKVKGINEPLFYYRYHSGSRITKSYEKEIVSYQLLWEKYREDYKRDKVASANMLLTISRTYMKKGNIIKATIYGIRAILCSPRQVVSMIMSYCNKKSQF
ncbi:MAG: glycosyltransferase family 2 protein [Selenomonas ruminantium]|nr:glycosyltransferase family 2 protein [Selenomonas ruminantium]